VGIVLGSLLSWYFGEKGIDLSGLYGEGLSEIGYDSVIFTVLTPEIILSVLFLVILTGMIASIYPAFKALRLNPSEAIRTDA
jgi:ABC-type antimicrobial peptide transport system permease subunit